MRSLVLTVAWLLGVALPAGAAPSYRAIHYPAPHPDGGAKFGAAVAILDYDSDGKADIAVGAPGERKVYVFFGGEFERRLDLSADGTRDSLKRDEAAALLPHEYSAGFGISLAAGQFDGVPGDELVVGADGATVDGVDSAGRVFILGQHLSPVVLQSDKPEPKARLGTSVALGDFDKDGALEIAAGSPTQTSKDGPGGRVIVYDVALGKDGAAKISQRTVGNAEVSATGNFGHDLAVTDGNHDGIDDLFVSAIGNDSSKGYPKHGQIVILGGPFNSDKATTLTGAIEDPGAKPAEEAGRFGMSIAARNGALAVGSPRHDAAGVKDAGMGFLFRHGMGALSFAAPKPIENGILGYRARLGDFTGDGGLEAAFFSLPEGVYLWNIEKPSALPSFVPRPELHCPHWCAGAAVGQIYPGGKDEMVLGGSDWASPSEPGKKDLGIVHVLKFD